MKIHSSQQVPSTPVEMPGASRCQVRQLLNDSHGAPNFAMRQFEVAPGGHTPRHSHPYEHEVFVLEGSGEVLEGETVHQLSAGDAVLVTPDEVHQFRNTGQRPLRFLCMVPNSHKQLPVKAIECAS